MTTVQNRIALSNAIFSMAASAAEKGTVGFVVASSGPGCGNGVAAAASAQILDLSFDIVDGLAPVVPARASVLLTMFCEGPVSENVVECIERLRDAPAGTVVVLAVQCVPVDTVVAVIHEAMRFNNRTVEVSACHRPS